MASRQRGRGQNGSATRTANQARIADFPDARGRPLHTLVKLKTSGTRASDEVAIRVAAD